MTTYFINCKNLDELKKAYKAAALLKAPVMIFKSYQTGANGHCYA